MGRRVWIGAEGRRAGAHDDAQAPQVGRKAQVGRGAAGDPEGSDFGRHRMLGADVVGEARERVARRRDAEVDELQLQPRPLATEDDVVHLPGKHVDQGGRVRWAAQGRRATQGTWHKSRNAPRPTQGTWHMPWATRAHLDVAVDEACRVDCGDGRGQLLHHAEGGRRRDVLLEPIEERLQGAALEVLSGDMRALAAAASRRFRGGAAAPDGAGASAGRRSPAAAAPGGRSA